MLQMLRSYFEINIAFDRQFKIVSELSVLLINNYV